MQADHVKIPIERKPSETSTAASVQAGITVAIKHSDIPIKAKGTGPRCIFLNLALILTLCLVTIIALKINCRKKSGGIVHKCNYNCQSCSDSSGGPCPDICKDSHYSEYCSSICETYESCWFAPVLFVFIILYLLECFLCYEWDLDKRNLNSFREYMAELKRTPPSIIVHYECYHYKKTGTSVPTGHGGRIERTEKVVTKKGAEFFRYSSWEDKTEDAFQMEDDWERIFLCKTIKFKDEETRECFESFKKKVKDENNKDTHFDIDKKFEIPGYIERSLVSKETDARVPYCVNGMVFWFWSLLLLTWPYRVYLEIVARFKELKVIKVIKSTR